MTGWKITSELFGDTVDARNPAPADMVNIPFFTGFQKTSKFGGCLGMGFLNHQLYILKCRFHKTLVLYYKMGVY